MNDLTRPALGFDFGSAVSDANKLYFRGNVYPDNTDADIRTAELAHQVAAAKVLPAYEADLDAPRVWGVDLTIPSDLRSNHRYNFVDWSRTGHWAGTLMRRDRDYRTYVDSVWDARDGFMMTEWTRAGRHARSFGRSYKRTHFERAFHGAAADAIRSEAGMESIR